MNLIHNSKITPETKIIDWWTLLIKVEKVYGSLFPSFCVANIP
jgi:hypothetical protein